MSTELTILVSTATSLGFFHTLVGPDHYLPFIVMVKSGQWSMKKTTLITFLCGIGHILSSVVLGFIGIAFGVTVNKLVHIESVRGNIAAWFLIAFGFGYFVWGLRRALKNRPHTHLHIHSDGSKHNHAHTHYEEHTHVHVKMESKPNLTPWILFTIFIFGPCEPMIPLLMYPAAQQSTSGLLLVTVVFGGVTIATMMTIVLVSSYGISFLPLRKIERYSHALAGFAILACGLAIQFLGL